MKHLKMEHLENCFNKAIEIAKDDKWYVAVAVQFDDVNDVEIIINPIGNAEYKLKYYKSVYDEDLNHKHASGVKILGFTYGSGFEEIEKDLIG